MGMVLDEALARRVLPVFAVVMLVFVVFGFPQWGARRLATPAEPTVQPTSVASPTPAPMLTFVAPEIIPTQVARDLAPYPVYGPAADFRTVTWLNTDAPLHLADLRGQVVVLVFWAFLCPPCMPVLTNVNDWHERYGDEGLAIVGIHTPNVEIERDYDQLADALERLSITYPVAQDNDELTWRSYGQDIWPTVYLIDKRGYLRYQRIGEGGYDDIETAIVALLAEAE